MENKGCSAAHHRVLPCSQLLLVVRVIIGNKGKVCFNEIHSALVCSGLKTVAKGAYLKDEQLFTRLALVLHTLFISILFSLAARLKD